MARGFKPQTISRDSAIGGMDIPRSLRVDQGTSNVSDGSFYYRTFADGNKRTFTISVWFKKCYTVGNIGDDAYTIISCGGGGTGSYAGRFGFDVYDSDQLNFNINNPAPTLHAAAKSTRKFRDDTWYHAVLTYDSTQATESDRIKMYVNGELETLDSPTYPSQNYEGYFNNNVIHRVGSTTSWSTGQDLGQFNGYLAEFHFIDGTTYDASHFGYTEQQTGIWRPKRVTGLTYGTNGFYLNFSDNTNTTTIGYDYSGNANHFSPHDVQVSDSVPDSPTNDFCMMSGLNKNSGLSHGNLQFYKWDDSNAALVFCQASMDLPNTGKWVWETRWTGYQHTRYWGITRRMRAQGAYIDNSAYVYYDMYDGKTYSGLNGSAVTTLTGGQTSYGDNVTRFWMMACDMDAMQASFYYNNTLISTIAIPELPDDGKGNYVWTWTSSNGGSGSTYDDRFNFGQDATYFGAASPPDKKDASGLGQFYTTVPDGHKCLCTKNLPPRTDVIVEPQKHFDVLTYTGNNNSGRLITGLKFKPDFVWFKKRSGGGQNHTLYDSVRGAGKRLMLPSTDGEGTVSDELTSFNDGGFTIDTDNFQNENGKDYVAWCWKAGGAAVTNNDGSGTSQVSANQEAGFSIVTYTGNATGSATSAVWQTIGHGLGKTPKWIVFKSRSFGDADTHWANYHVGVTDANTDYVVWDTTEARIQTDVNYMGSTLPTSSVFSLGYNFTTNKNGEDYVAYCWAEIPGFSKFGRYKGTGNSNGSFINVGFKPAWVLVKGEDFAGNWNLFDIKRPGVNPINDRLFPNLSSSELDGSSSNNQIDIYSNGFKLRGSNVDTNSAGSTYLYMAFAEQTSLNQFNLAVNGF